MPILLDIFGSVMRGGLTWLGRGRLPQIEGGLDLRGLIAPVEVIRDRWGIPHIYAANQHDLFFTQGYLHAQDRFWQMDFWRHIGAGRLSEMFGASQLDTDRFLRTLGWRRVAQTGYQMEIVVLVRADADLRQLDDLRGKSLAVGARDSMTYQIVSEKEADLKLSKISVTSPIGKGLLGKKVGEVAEIQAPNGQIRFRIDNITV